MKQRSMDARNASAARQPFLRGRRVARPAARHPCSSPSRPPRFPPGFPRRPSSGRRPRCGKSGMRTPPSTCSEPSTRSTAAPSGSTTRFARLSMIPASWCWRRSSPRTAMFQASARSREVDRARRGTGKLKPFIAQTQAAVGPAAPSACRSNMAPTRCFAGWPMTWASRSAAWNGSRTSLASSPTSRRRPLPRLSHHRAGAGGHDQRLARRLDQRAIPAPSRPCWPGSRPSRPSPTGC